MTGDRIVHDDGMVRAERAIRGGDLAGPCLSVLPVIGAAVAVLHSPMHSGTFDATNSVAARIDELQFDLGEGPAWAAVASTRPVVIADLRNTPDSARWPLFDDAVQGLPVRGLFVFPLLIGAAPLGVLTLYRAAPGPLTDAAVASATSLAQVIAPVLARRVLNPAPIDLAAPAEPHDRSRIYQATGVVMAELGMTAETAFARIQAHAFSTATTMADVAGAVITGHLQLSDEPTTP